jgi:hypothetical protein
VFFCGVAGYTKIRQLELSLVNSLIHTFFAMFQATPSPKTTRDINVESQSPINLSQDSGTSPYSPQKLKVELDEEDYNDEEDEISSRQVNDWKQVFGEEKKTLLTQQHSHFSWLYPTKDGNVSRCCKHLECNYLIRISRGMMMILPTNAFDVKTLYIYISVRTFYH